MKTAYKFAFLFFIAALAFTSCQDQDDIAAPNNIEIQDFIWKGLNQYYLWQPDVPNLSDDRFATQEDLNAFLRGYPVPKNFLMP